MPKACGGHCLESCGCFLLQATFSDCCTASTSEVAQIAGAKVRRRRLFVARARGCKIRQTHMGMCECESARPVRCVRACVQCNEEGATVIFFSKFDHDGHRKTNNSIDSLPGSGYGFHISSKLAFLQNLVRSNVTA